MTGPISQLDATISGETTGAGGGAGVPGTVGAVGGCAGGGLIEPPLLPPQLSALRVIATTMLVANSFAKEAGSLNKSLTRLEYYDYLEDIPVIGFILTHTTFLIHRNVFILDAIYFDINAAVPRTSVGGAPNRSALREMRTEPQSPASSSEQEAAENRSSMITRYRRTFYPIRCDLRSHLELHN